MFIVIIEQPSKTLIDTHNIVMQVIKDVTKFDLHLFFQLSQESLVIQQVVHSVDYLLDVQVYICVEVFVPDWMDDFELALPRFG